MEMERIGFLGLGAMGGPIATRMADWAQRNAGGVTQFRAMIARAQARPPVGAAMLAQIASQARNLLER
jgi:glutamate dehydrogenase